VRTAKTDGLSKKRKTAVDQEKILKSVDQLLEVHDRWVANPDPNLKSYPPQDFEMAAEVLFETILGQDIPAPLRGLARSIEDFQAQWQLYVNGARETDGRAKGSLWRAFRQIIKDRAEAVELVPKRPEPVHVLLGQKVSPQQIALYIYGHKGKGPFLKDGAIQYKLIEQEAKEPGSVITDPNWLPGYEEERLRAKNITKETRLRQIDDRIGVAAKAQDPVSLLREGQFVDVIAKVCNLTEDEVLGIAKVMKIEPSYRTPLTGNVRGPYMPELRETDAAMMDSMAAKPAMTAQAAAERGPKKVRKGTIAEAWELFEQGKSAPEIAAELGQDLTAQDVAKMLRGARPATV
jgi:hypothetical protein